MNTTALSSGTSSRSAASTVAPSPLVRMLATDAGWSPLVLRLPVLSLDRALSARR